VNSPLDNYPVGYGRPPLKSRWKKGQSGNPRKRRPKEPQGTVSMTDRLLLARVQITLNGEKKRIPVLEAIVLQLQQKELSGNRQASRVLMRYQEFATRNLKKTLELRFVDNEYTTAFATARGTEHG
jgi:Family of unknown function (DUF5681)